MGWSTDRDYSPQPAIAYYDLYLLNPGPDRSIVARILRSLTAWPYFAIKQALDDPPVLIGTYYERESDDLFPGADTLAQWLESGGATTEVLERPFCWWGVIHGPVAAA